MPRQEYRIPTDACSKEQIWFCVATIILIIGLIVTVQSLFTHSIVGFNSVSPHNFQLYI